MPENVLRIIDANANRAREALRVMEDYARFILNDDELCSSLKQARHDFASAIGPVLHDAILHRDTPGDVGTQVKTDQELVRDDASAVVIAAGKRLTEALRTIEEFSKTIDPQIARKVEAIRYRAYDIEQKLARTLCSSICRFAGVRLYVLITESLCKKPWLETAHDAIAGGADCLQLREKNLEGAELLRRARQLVALCRTHRVLSVINDRPDIAILSDADGVHVGQDDLPLIELRKLMGSRKIIGVSTHCIEQARQAARDGADYIGVGPVFRSNTKPREISPGLDYARLVASEIRIPAVAIAGITQENVAQVIATGIKAIAVTAAVISQEDVRAAAASLKKMLAAADTENTEITA
jgi:thiamine-phosphate pyrophosphorylase